MLTNIINCIILTSTSHEHWITKRIKYPNHFAFRTQLLNSRQLKVTVVEFYSAHLKQRLCPKNFTAVSLCQVTAKDRESKVLKVYILRICLSGKHETYAKMLAETPEPYFCRSLSLVVNVSWPSGNTQGNTSTSNYKKLTRVNIQNVGFFHHFQ